LQISAEKCSGIAIACLVLCVSGCGDPEPIAAEPATTADGERRLAFILGLPDLRRGETARELPTNVTLMEEGAGRFFGTRDAANCWTDVEVHEQMQPTESTTYSVSGVLYCVAPLAELNGDSNVSFADLTFTGRVIWGVPK
jgi:hypothetical protein